MLDVPHQGQMTFQSAPLPRFFIAAQSSFEAMKRCHKIEKLLATRRGAPPRRDVTPDRGGLLWRPTNQPFCPSKEGGKRPRKEFP